MGRRNPRNDHAVSISTVNPVGGGHAGLASAHRAELIFVLVGAATRDQVTVEGSFVGWLEESR